MNPQENPSVTPVPDTLESKIPESASDLKQIRTYQGDIAHAIKGQDESLFSIQQAERARQGIQEESPEEKGRSRNRIKAVLLFFMGFLLVVAGVVGGWYSYVEFGKKSALPDLEILASELIPARERADIDATALTRSSLVSAVATASQEADLPLGEVLHINLVSKEETDETSQELTTTQKFLAILEVRAPGSLVRAFSPTFMLGSLREARSIPPIEIVASSTPVTASSTPPIPEGASTSTPQTSPEPKRVESVFLIIKLESFENAFAGMLEWESKISEDLGPLFSTRALAINVPTNPTWSDVTDRNKDSRILYSENRQVVLVYSFFDTNTLVITDSQETLRTILGRLTNQLLSR